MSAIKSIVSSLRDEATSLGQAKIVFQHFGSFKAASWNQLQDAKAIDTIMALALNWEINDVINPLYSSTSAI